ncbi:hypothetical protein SAMN04488503_2455 [Humidesulfovibrio mexicanus]|uniref:Methylase-associated X1 domain-containing protein n=1 Tax=Humidesulfovibrio mexicanus TaxID=147047 RepID=A0A239B7W4_9BACT|nr:hypothetical protein SAMN04488503_2455 [Humidesulfovibrio mexicanus]
MLIGGYRRWGVSRSDKEPLLRFILAGLEDAGCRVLYHSDPGEAPFLVSFETPSGERQSILCYAFLANSKLTKNRPDDEHRFQVKLGSDPKAILDLYQDPLEVTTTLFVGIDPERGFLVAADPVLHSPTKMFISIEFKRSHAEAIEKDGWCAWERASARRPGQPVEVLVGAVRSRLLDLVRFERAAKGLDQGHRQLLAEKFKGGLLDLLGARKESDRHRLIKELGLSGPALFDLIDETARLKMAVRGWVAEVHLEKLLQAVPDVSRCARINEEGKPDISLLYHHHGPILIECKNVLRTVHKDGYPRLDFQKTRASKADPCSRYYRPEDFSIVAACLHSITEEWEFRYALTRVLPEHLKCPGRIKSAIQVKGRTWFENPAEVLELAARSA